MNWNVKIIGKNREERKHSLLSTLLCVYLSKCVQQKL